MNALPTYVPMLGEIAAERRHQQMKWGEQNHPDGTGGPARTMAADRARQRCEWAFKIGKGTWSDILTEEFEEAMAESDPVKLREELIQVAAVATAWVEAIDRRLA